MVRFASSRRAVELDFKLGCQPSTNGSVLELVGLSPDKVRLDDDVKCVGDRMPDGEVGTLACKVDGKIGRFLSKNLIGLSPKVAGLLPMNLAVPMVAAAPAPSGNDRAGAGGSGGVATGSAPAADAAGKAANKAETAAPADAPGKTAGATAGPTGGPAASPSASSSASSAGAEGPGQAVAPPERNGDDVRPVTKGSVPGPAPASSPVK